jgi:hypothetical protein
MINKIIDILYVKSIFEIFNKKGWKEIILSFMDPNILNLMYNYITINIFIR